ncbi:MAG: hypothetical protein KDE33_18055 [Bacteroidetes bacterium]|nr:hypothetical protein [Bacteroidota bacterium]MCB9227391.1 hypothetical protein [Chitinophagales bacterium]
MFQFISNKKGETTGVYIPIEEWEKIVESFPGLNTFSDVPKWQKDLVKEQKAALKENPNSFMEFDSFIDEVEKTL